MKTFFLSIVFLMVYVIAFAQDKAHISFDVKKHDFGTIYQNKDSVVSVKFYFENTENTPLVILNVSTSCDCTVPE